MNILYVYTITAGILWGVWPILMNKSGLSGFASATVFAFVVLLTVAPVGLISNQVQKIELTPTLIFAILAGLLGGLGVLAFNTMLSKVEPRNVGVMIMVMVMFQLAVPAIYQIIQGGDFSPRKIVGVVGAFVVAYLLS